MGFKSEYSENHWDRRFKFYTAKAPAGFYLDDCRDQQGWANTYDDPFDFKCPANQVIGGMRSEHEGNTEDRVWRFRCCKIKDDAYKIIHVRDTGYGNEWKGVFDHHCAEN